MAVVILVGTLAGALVVATATQAGATTIVSETFTGATVGTPANWVSGGTGTLGTGTNAACLTGGTNTTQPGVPGCGGTAESPGALRLTTNGTNQTGWALYNTPVAAASGLNITFNTFQINGTGADGISFFIVPGTTNLTAPGSFGGYLGYGGGGTGAPTGTNGVANGIVNVGLDVYGNNAWTGYDGGNCAAGSTSSFPLSAAGEPTASVPESVTVRGPGNLQNGYCYIANSGNLVTSGGAAHSLDYPAATTRAASNTVGVNIVIPPPNATGPVPNITITLTFPNATTKVITAPEPPTSYIPTTFKFGFAGSSGSDTEYHEINNLSVTTSIPNPGVTSVSPAQTAVGTTRNVTITGINFNGATGVTVGGVAATNVVVVSNTQITATVPANATAGVYDTLVTGPGGTSVVNSGDKFTYGSSTTTLASSANPSVVGQSVTYTATAASSAASASSVVPTGNIEFLDGGVPIAACGGATGVAVNGSGTATCAAAYAAPGSHTITAQYLGDVNYTGSTATAVTQVVNKASTTTTLGSSANPSVAGASVTFTGTAAAVAPGAGTPTGNIEFLQAGVPVAACGGATGVAVNGSGVATCAVTFPTSGTYAMTATYLGDTNFTGSTSTALSQVVSTAASTTTLGSSVNPSVTGQSVTFTGTASGSVGTPTGNIEFLQAGVPVAACGGATGVAVNGSGVATCAVSFAATGTYAMTAKYLGSTTYAASTSTAVSQVVNKASTTTTLGSSVNPSVTGQSVTFTGTAAAAAPGTGTPTGNIEFLQAGVPVAACGGATGVAVNGSGVATCAVTFSATGTYAMTATYLGSANYTTSTSSALSQVVNKASTTTTLGSSVNPSVTGQSVTFTGTAAAAAPGTGTPTGNIEFLQAGVPVAACGGATGVAVNGSGVATCAVTFSATGTYAMTATYLGSANYTTSTSTALSQVVNKASTTTTLASSVNPSVTGQQVTFTATAAAAAPGSGTPTGNIEFLQGGVPVAACGGATGVAVGGTGQATCSVTYNATGTTAVTAVYLGDANYATSTSPVVNQVVNKASTLTALSSSVNPSKVGQSVTFTAIATPVSPGSGVPTGKIEFLQGGVPIAACGGATGVTVDGTGKATCAVTYNAIGTYAITATYLGDGNYTTSTSTPVSQAVGQTATTTSLGSSVNPSVTGQPVTFTATATPVAPGTGTPTGNIEFLQAGVPIGACGGATGVTVNGSGTATCAVTYAAAGSYNITATYLGDTNYVTSTSSVVAQVVNKAATTTSLGSSVNPSVTGQQVTFTATATATAPGTGTPTGNIEFRQGGTPIAACGGATGVAVNGSGTATCAVTFGATGTSSITATYLGDTNYATSTSGPVSQVVNKASTTTTLASSVNPSVTGQPVTFTATVATTAPGSGTPTGKIEFLQGGNPIAACGGASGVAVNGSGAATCAVTYNASGTYAITATYLSDGNYATSTSSVLNQVVDQATTTTSLGSSVNPSVTGQPVTYTAVVAPVAPGTGTPTGTIEFLQGGVPVASCGGASGVAVDGTGTAICTVTYAGTGSTTVTAVYLGDANYVTSTSAPVTQVVDQATTLTTLGSSSNPSVTGQQVTYTAIAAPVAPGAGTPTGNIEFLDGATPIADCGGASGVTVDGTGTATCAVTYPAIGSHTITAVYLGDTNFAGSTSTPVVQAVDQGATATSLGSSANPSTAGDSVTYTAVAAPVAPATGTPTGNIEFLDGATPIADCGGASGVTVDGTGTAQCTTTYPVSGSHTITAVYLGDTNYSTSSSTPLTQVVDPIPTSVTASASPDTTVFGQSTTITADVPVGATGTVTFTGPGAVLLCTATVTAGQATCDTTALPVGTDTVDVAYSGDPTYGPSSTTTTVTVGQADTTTSLGSSADPSTAGDPVTYTSVVVPVAPGAGIPTGFVEFLDGGTPIADCGGAFGTPLDGTGTAQCTTTYPVMGTHTITAEYLGDTGFTASDSTPLVQVVDLIATSVTASASPDTTVSGQSTTITADVPVGATGTVTFTGPGDVVLCTATVTAGQATCDTSALPVGADTVTVAYSGDDTYGPSSTTTPVTVAQAATTTSLGSSANPSTAGDAVTFTGTVSVQAPGAGTPTANIEFLDGGVPIADCGGATGVPVDGGGTAQCTTTFPDGGDFAITAVYLGDTDLAGSTSTVLDQTVNLIPTSVTASASPDATVVGQSTTITAVLPAGATGTVTFTGPGDVVLCTATVTAGQATCDTSALPLGTDTVDVVYSGDATYAGSSTTTSVTVSQASTATTLGSSENPANIGDTVTYTATVTPLAPGSGTPTGNVEFLANGTPIAACGGATGVALDGSGSATCDQSYGSPGSIPIDATYLGDANYTGSSAATLTQVVSPDRSTTTASASPSATVFGQPTTITATVTPGATGTVTFTGPGDVVLCTATVSAGTATCDTSVLPVGTDTVTVAYSGDGTYGPSSTTTTVTVSRAATTTAVVSSANPSSAGDSVTYTATVGPVAPGAGTPTGFVRFTDDGTPVVACGGTFGVVLDGSAQATCAETYATAGSHAIVATYLGDTDFSGSTSSTLTQVVDHLASTTGASASPTSTVTGQPTTITATVTPGATGTVTFTGPGSVVLCTATITAGTATCTTTVLPVGTDTVTATYNGDGVYSPSSGTTTVTVTKASTTTALTSTPNPSNADGTVTFTATVTPVSPGSGTPTGNVEFLDGGTPIAACGGAAGVALSGGHAVCDAALATAGNHTITAVYLGGAGYDPSTSPPLTQVVDKAPTTIGVSVSPNPITGAPVTITATVSPGSPTGTVTFTGPGGVVLCTATVVSGRAVCVTTQLPAGTSTVTVAYSGDGSHLPSSTGVSITVTQAISPRGQGYWTDAADGGIFTFGNKHFYGSTGSLVLNAPAVGMASTQDDGGYWLVATDGGVFAFGDAGFYGSTGSIHLNQPIEGIAPTGDGKGYWMSASDGGIFAFGDATFHGSLGGLPLNKPIVGMSPTPDGNGYWLVASDGGVFAFGDAGFYGSAGAIHLNKPIVAMAATPDGRGYWLVATDGGIFAFGDAGFFGSTGSIHLNEPIVGIATSPTGNGYWIDASDGGVFSFGDTKFWGSMGGLPLNKPMVGMSI